METSRYEFHKSRLSEIAENSYIYMLDTKTNVAFNEVEEYFEPQESEKTESSYVSSDSGVTALEKFLRTADLDAKNQNLKTFRTQKSLGSTIERIHSLRDGGFMIQYEHGDICNEETG